mgnify:CR=1 FL=1
MNKQDVITFFDYCASSWDARMIRNESVINTILDHGGVSTGCTVLDVACGTGVLFPDYLHRNVKSVTAVDISPEMARIAAGKYPNSPIEVICGDIETLSLDQKFDCCMVYNAFPHFPDPKHLIAVLASHLKPGGTLSVAHGMSRERINRHHERRASKVSMGLLSEQELSNIFAQYLEVTTVISDDTMYQVCGRKSI